MPCFDNFPINGYEANCSPPQDLRSGPQEGRRRRVPALRSPGLRRVRAAVVRSSRGRTYLLQQGDTILQLWIWDRVNRNPM
jgi:hypothetical protein